MLICKHCALRGEGKYCSQCGEIYEPHRITIHSLIHEVVHTFTHADKGLLYTLKNLAIRPGIMQKNYLEGERKTNQKPFPLFFICASITAIVLHYLNEPSPDSQSHFDIVKGIFYKNYFVIFQTILLPFFALLTWLIFYRKNFNYAESLVLSLYALAFSLLMIIPINFLGYAFNFNEQLAELVVLSIYMMWTNINFFTGGVRWKVILKSLVLLGACYATSYFVTGLVIQFML